MTAREPWFEALGVARELRDSLDDPRRGEWGGYPWEHLGDSERDVRVLLAGIEAAREALRAIHANAVSWHGPSSSENRHSAALAVIAGWSYDPQAIPEAVRAAARDALDAEARASHSQSVPRP